MKILVTKTSIVTLFFAALLHCSPSKACSCSDLDAVGVCVRYADVVFRGRVVDRNITLDLSEYGVKVDGDSASSWLKGPIAVLRIQVDAVYKGGKADTIIILTPAKGASCGVSFAVGEQWIIYGTYRDQILATKSINRISTRNNVYWTNLCTRSMYWDKQEEQEIIKALSKKRMK